LVLYTLIGACFAASGVALWAAIDAWRFHLSRSSIPAFAGALALAVGGVALLWLVNADPRFTAPRDLGFPSGWTCLDLGRGAAQVCGRDPHALARPTSQHPL
jgi:hypothetical protein